MLLHTFKISRGSKYFSRRKLKVINILSIITIMKMTIKFQTNKAWVVSTMPLFKSLINLRKIIRMYKATRFINNKNRAIDLLCCRQWKPNSSNSSKCLISSRHHNLQRILIINNAKKIIDFLRLPQITIISRVIQYLQMQLRNQNIVKTIIPLSLGNPMTIYKIKILLWSRLKGNHSNNKRVTRIF